MKIFLLVINLLGFAMVGFSQPMPTGPVKVDGFFLKHKSLLFIPINGMFQNVTQKEKKVYDKNNGYESELYLTINTNYTFINKKDTMKIKLMLDKYSNYQISITKLFFKKGSYIIDFKKCVEKYKKEGYGVIAIENFPCDCIAYRKEEE